MGHLINTHKETMDPARIMGSLIVEVRDLIKTLFSSETEVALPEGQQGRRLPRASHLGATENYGLVPLGQ